MNLTRTEAERLAEAIARDLCMNGSGEKAARLVLAGVNHEYLGGWSPRAIQDRILKHLCSSDSLLDRNRSAR